MNPTSPFQRVISDIWELCELQIQLLSVDSQAARRRATVALALCGGALTLGGPALILIALGFAFLLAEWTPLSQAASLLTVGVTFTCVSLLLVRKSLASIRDAAASMDSSKNEFVESIKWLKATLIYPDSSPRNRFRQADFSRDEQAPPANSRPVDSSHPTRTAEQPFSDRHNRNFTS